MRKFTKSLLTLALLMVSAVSANASVETVIKSIDYTTNPVAIDGVAYSNPDYPYYFDAGWISASATAPTLNAGSLELTNATTDNYQAFINDWAIVKKGYSYKAKVVYKSTVAGNVNFTFGTWGNSLDKNDVAISATDSWTVLPITLGTANFSADATAHLILKFAFAGTIYVKKVEIIEVAPDVVTMTEVEKFEAPTGTVDVKDLTGTNTTWATTVVYPKEFAVQGSAFGNGDGSSESNHVNIDGYDYLCFYVTTAADNTAGLRVWIWDGEAGGAGSVKTLYAYPIADYATADYTAATKLNAGVGTYVTKVTGYKYLKGVKAANDWGSPASVVSVAYMCTGDPVAYTSTGKTTVSGTEYLADPAITCIDVTGLITTGQTLDAVNPNTLFIANDGVLTNTKNVIVSGTCANLELVDGKPFNTPVAFTASKATFSKTVSDANYATMVLPFAAAIPTGVEAYNITGNTGNVLKTEKADAIAANKPVMLKNSGTFEFTATDVDIAATPSEAQQNGLLFGVYSTTDVPVANGYVLQNQSEVVNFYKADEDTKVNAFRAYLTATAGARLVFDFDSATAIKGVKEVKSNGAVFNLNGQRVKNAQKGLYIQNGKKFMVK